MLAAEDPGANIADSHRNSAPRRRRSGPSTDRGKAADGFQFAVDAGLGNVARNGQWLHARLEAVLADVIYAGAGAGFEADDDFAVDLAGLPGAKRFGIAPGFAIEGLAGFVEERGDLGIGQAGEAAVLVE